MLYECKSFFEENSHLIAKKNAGRLFLYMTFVIRFCQKFNIKIKDNAGWIGFLKKNISPSFGYEIKEAMLAFDSNMPWIILERDRRLYDSFCRLFGELDKKRYIDERWLLDTAEGILSAYEGYDATPKAIRRAAAELVGSVEFGQIVDLCCGGYFLGLELYLKSARSEAFCSGEERDPYMCAVAGMMLFLCNAESFSIKEKNVLCRTERGEANKLPRVFAADLPLSGNRTIPVPSRDELFANNKQTLYADWYVMYNVLEEMTPGDRAVFIVTKGALVRENERFLREYYVKNDCIGAVIALPRGIYPKSRLPMEMIIFEKGRQKESGGKVLIADLTDCKPYELEEKICGMQNGDICAEEARLVFAEEIAKREYELNPRLYLAKEEESGEGLSVGDVACVTRGLQNTSQQGMYAENRYLLNIRDIQNGEILYENADVIRGGAPHWEDKFLIREDDIILTAKGAAMKIAIVPSNPPKAYISGNLMIIRVNPERYSAYVLYEYLASKTGQKALGLIQTGTTIRVIGTKKLQQLSIPEYKNITAVGDGLKAAGINYRRTIREIGEDFSSKKKELLELLK